MNSEDGSNLNDVCPICRKEKMYYNERYQANVNADRIKCKICGDFKISLEDFLALTSKDKSFDENRHIFSGIIRHYSNVKARLPYEFNLESEKAYLDSPLIPDERIDNLDLILQYISDNEEYAGHELVINANYDYPIAFAKNEEEMSWFLKILCNNLKWIDNPRSARYVLNERDRYVLNEKGWEQLVRIKREKKETNQIFVAMPFSKNMDKIWQNGYSAAIAKCGYKPFRVDKKEHNEKIDDEIIAGIKSSCCVIADATYRNEGVYYEAGFAKGLDLPVVWACCKGYFDSEKVHFDTQQYNHILWNDAQDLYEKLMMRLKATLPIRE